MPIYSLWFHVIKCRSLRPYFLRGNGSCSDSIDTISGVCRIVTYQVLKEKYKQAHKIILLLASSYALHHIWVCLKIGYPMVRTGLSSCSLWKCCFFWGVSPWQTHFRPTLGPQAAMADDLNIWKLILRGATRKGRCMWWNGELNMIWCGYVVSVCIYIYCYMMYVYIYIYRGHVYDLGLMIDEDFMGIPWRFDGDKSQRYHGEIYAPPPPPPPPQHGHWVGNIIRFTTGSIPG